MIEQHKKRKRHWHTIYRLVLRKDETLEEIGSYRLTLLNLYILLSSIVLIAMGLMAMVIFFTPLKRLVPGYGTPSQHPDYISLNKKITALEAEIIDYKSYYEHFSRMITHPDSIEAPVTAHTSKVRSGSLQQENDPVIQEDEKPRPLQSVAVKSSTPDAMLDIADYRYLMPPISGVVSNGFDPKTDHLGVDVLAPHNTPVKAIWDGHVITADWTLETGYTIGIQHTNDMVSFYKHNASLLKRNGAFVRAGEAIAIIGNTGKLTSGPHLHFELWLQGKPVDPANYIDF